MLEKFYKNNKQLVDQTLHFVVGFALAALFSVWVEVPIAVYGVLTVAVVREMFQHPDGECGIGCTIDILFWALGALAYVPFTF